MFGDIVEWYKWLLIPPGALRRPKRTIITAICNKKYDLTNNKVIIIIDNETWGQTLKNETAVLVLAMPGENISTAKFLATALGILFDLVSWVDQVKIPKLKVRYWTELNLHASKVRTAPRCILKPNLNYTNQNHGDKNNDNNNQQNILVSLKNRWTFWKSLVYAILTKLKPFAIVGWGWKTRLSNGWWPLVGFDNVISLNDNKYTTKMAYAWQIAIGDGGVSQMDKVLGLVFFMLYQVSIWQI